MALARGAKSCIGLLLSAGADYNFQVSSISYHENSVELNTWRLLTPFPNLILINGKLWSLNILTFCRLVVLREAVFSSIILPPALFTDICIVTKCDFILPNVWKNMGERNLVWFILLHIWIMPLKKFTYAQSTILCIKIVYWSMQCCK